MVRQLRMQLDHTASCYQCMTSSACVVAGQAGVDDSVLSSQLSDVELTAIATLEREVRLLIGRAHFVWLQIGETWYPSSKGPQHLHVSACSGLEACMDPAVFLQLKHSSFWQPDSVCMLYLSLPSRLTGNWLLATRFNALAHLAVLHRCDPLQISLT